MRKFAIRLFVNAVAIAVTATILSGIELVDNSIVTLLIIAAIFGVVNALIKPIITFLTCPLVFLTLGLFLFVINGLMLLITEFFSGGRLEVDGFWTAILGGIVMGITGMVLENVLGLDDDDGDEKRRVIFMKR